MPGKWNNYILVLFKMTFLPLSCSFCIKVQYTAWQISNQQFVCKILMVVVMENWSTHRLNYIKNA